MTEVSVSDFLEKFHSTVFNINMYELDKENYRNRINNIKILCKKEIHNYANELRKEVRILFKKQQNDFINTLETIEKTYGLK